MQRRYLKISEEIFSSNHVRMQSHGMFFCRLDRAVMQIEKNAAYSSDMGKIIRDDVDVFCDGMLCSP